MEEQRKSENALVPALRFEGFSDPWEQRKVGDYLVESRERGSSGDVAKKLTVKLWGKGVTEKAEISGSAHTQYYVRHAGQFIYSKLDFLNAAFGVIPDNLDEYESTADLPAFDVSNLDARFLLLKATQRSFYLRYGTIADGSRKAKRIHSEAFLAMPLFVPDYIEQTRIANLFARLDSLIALHQRKHEKLKTVKQSLLEKMFPKEGEDVPEIRFEGFTDPWEQCKLGECGTTYGGLSGKTKEDFGHGDALFVPYTNVFENPITDTGRLEAIEIDSKQNEVRFGDAFFTVSSETPEDVGMSSIWLSDQPDVYLNSFCFGYRQDGSFDPFYLAYMLRAQSMRSKLMLLAQGISRFNISKKKVMELDASCPRIEEQRQIGSFFRNLDSLIALHQRERAGV